MDAGHPDDRRRLHRGLSALAEAPPGALADRLAALFHPEVEWRGSHPLDEMRGLDAVRSRVWEPMRRAFPIWSGATSSWSAGATRAATTWRRWAITAAPSGRTG